MNIETQETLEKEVLANILVYNDLIDFAKGRIVSVNVFTSELNKTVYATYLKLTNESLPITKGNLENTLAKSPMKDIDWRVFINDLAGESTTEEYGKKLINELMENYSLREMAGLFKQSIMEIENGDHKSELLGNRLRAELLRIASYSEASSFKHVGTTLTEVIENAQTRNETGNIDKESINTGYSQLNRYLHGFKPGQLIVVAGRPGSGKTTLGINFLKNIIRERSKRPIIFASKEVIANHLVVKLISSKVGRTMDFIESGKWLDAKTEQERDVQYLVLTAIEELRQSNIYFDDTLKADIGAFEANVKSFVKDEKPLLIIVDYLQLFEDRSIRGRTRENEVAKISRTLKQMALELKCPVIALSQLGRKPDTRADKRPILSDLRESGAIEQDADIVMLLHTEEKEIEEENTTENAIASFTEINIAKNRHGPTGALTLIFTKEHSLFTQFDTGQN